MRLSSMIERTCIKDNMIRLTKHKKTDSEIAAIKKLIGKNRISIVDVGAHNGDFIERIKKSFEIQHAVLFEPIPDCFDKLNQRYTSYKVINQVVSDTPGMVTFNVNEQKQTSSMFNFLDIEELSNVDKAVRDQVRIDATTLDIELKQFGTVDLLKVDVQGAEHLVFKGGKNTLPRTEVIYVEVSFKKLYEKSSDFFDIHHFLNEQGFLLREIFSGHRSEIGELLQANAIFFNSKKS